MITKVRKRDGKIVKFDSEKIAFAIFRATRAIKQPERELSERVADRVVARINENFKNKSMIDIEKIQDIVEQVLIETRNSKLAKSYILYREQHKNIRNIKDLFSNIKIIDDYLDQKDWKVKENANMAYSLQGLNFHISSIISSQYWLNQIYSEEVREAHESGDMHIHDLGTLSVYCVGWDLQDLLLSGFKGVQGKIESKPAKHFRSILGQIVNFFYTLQGEAAGAQAFSNFDTLLAPFIFYDNLSYTEVKQTLQEFIFNINIPTRVGFQTPFTNITMDLYVPDFLRNQPVIIGGIPGNKTYSDFQKEMDLLNRCFAEVMVEGDAMGRVFTFPIPTYNITKNFNWDNKNLNPVWDMTARYGIPYFSNFVNSDLNPDDVRSMCCRLRLDNRELKKRGGGLFGANPLTGSIGVVTINLPRIGFLSKNEDDFFQRLDKIMEIGKQSLETKRTLLEQLTDKGLFPYAKFYLRDIYKRNNSYWTNHFSTIGLIGMNEACINFLGQDITQQKGHDFALKVLDFMREKLFEYQQDTGNIYNLEATPAEGTAFKLAMTDKNKFKEIIVANESEIESGIKPYYTNSSQLPVNYTDDIFEALRIQDDFQTKYTGGTVFHGFIGEKQIPVESIKNLIKKVTDNFRLPYFTITPTFSICPEHGYIYGEHYKCPECSSSCEVYSRVVGYLRPVKQWNDGKQSEFNDRKLFDKSLETFSNPF
ncbi:ribonucleoside triphosphate reductase [bacterium]|nr:ribonucleoside triphosphate reductase [bacterium]